MNCATHVIDLRESLGDAKIVIDGKMVFEMRKDGTFAADWAKLRELRDHYVAEPLSPHGVSALACTFAAALWAARNS